MSEHKIPIPSMLYNAAVGGHVTNSQQIIDENENKEQSQINVEVKQNLINLADNEDIIRIDDGAGNKVLKFADRTYNVDNFSGKGYKILRKNMTVISVPRATITALSAPTTDGYISVIIDGVEIHIDVTTADTIYDLCKKIATNIELKFNKFSVIYTDTTVELKGLYDFTISDVTISAVDTGATFGSIINEKIQKNINLLTQDMITEVNTIYILRYDFDLNNNTIKIPDNCTLQFEGGSVQNGTFDINGCEVIGEDAILCKFVNPKDKIIKLSTFGAGRGNSVWDTKILQYIGALKFKGLFFDRSVEIIEPIIFKGFNFIKGNYSYAEDIEYIKVNAPYSDAFIFDFTLQGIVEYIKIFSKGNCISLKSCYKTYFNNMYCKSDNGNCFALPNIRRNFHTRFYRIWVESPNGAGFLNFFGNTQKWEYISCSNCFTVFRNCSGVIDTFNGTWGKSNHFMLWDYEYSEGEKIPYGVNIVLNNCNIESFADTAFVMNKLGTCGLHFLNSIVYNYSIVDGILKKPSIIGNVAGVNLCKSTIYNPNVNETECHYIVTNLNMFNCNTDTEIKIFSKKLDKEFIIKPNIGQIKKIGYNNYEFINENNTCNDFTYSKNFNGIPEDIYIYDDKTLNYIDVYKHQNIILYADNDDGADKYVYFTLKSGQTTQYTLKYIYLYNNSNSVMIINNTIKLHHNEYIVYATSQRQMFPFIYQQKILLRKGEFEASVNNMLVINNNNELNYSYNNVWYDALGNPIGYKKYGTFDEKPSKPKIGYKYFCTDRQTSEGATDGIEIIHKGNNVWVDALGRVVS